MRRAQMATIAAQADTINALTSQLQKQVRCASCRVWGSNVEWCFMYVICDSNCRKRNVCRWCDASVLDASNAQAEHTDAKLEEQVGALETPSHIMYGVGQRQRLCLLSEM